MILKDIIRELDIPRLMAYIEALIMEVNVDKGFNSVPNGWEVNT
jgi:general secretion pathway protein D